MDLKTLQSDAQDRTTRRAKRRANGLDAVRKDSEIKENKENSELKEDSGKKEAECAESHNEPEKGNEPEKSNAAPEEAGKEISNDITLQNKQSEIIKASDISLLDASKRTAGGFMTSGMEYVKPESIEKRSKSMSLRVEPSRYKAFKDCCEQNGYSMNDVISSFMLAFTKNFEDNKK